MPAHIKGALTQTQLSVPVRDGRMMLGRYQGIYLFEHRRIPRQRELVLHLGGGCGRQAAISSAISAVIRDQGTNIATRSVPPTRPPPTTANTPTWTPPNS